MMRTGLFAEAGVVLVTGVVFAWVANQVSPRGLNLTRDYFATVVQATPTPLTTPPKPPAPGAAAVDAEINSAAATRLRERGLGVIDTAEATRLYRESASARPPIVFVDARDDATFESGHIPGARQLDYYHPEGYLPRVLEACRSAGQVVVYCFGGDCEDSELTAVLLTEAGIPAARLRVYLGGFSAWTNHALPVETGARQSRTPPVPSP